MAIGVSEHELVAAGASGEVFASFGGGLSVDTAGTTETLRATVMTSDSEAIAVGDGGTIAVHDAEGWTAGKGPVSADLHGLWTDGDTTVACGAGGTVLRKVGAAPWVPESSGEPGILYDVWGENAQAMYAVGEKGVLLRYGSGVWSKVGNISTDELRGVFGFTDDGPMFAVGGGGTVLRRTDGVWAKGKSPVTYVLHALWGPKPTQIFAVGNLGTMVRWDGEAWTEVTMPTKETLYDIAGRSDTEAYVVGASGVMLQWDGTTWSVLRSNTSANLRAVWGFGPKDVYAVGAKATIMHFNGLNWSQIKVEDQQQGDQAVAVTDQLYDFFGTVNVDTGDQEMFAFGASGTVIQRDIQARTGKYLWVKVPQADNVVTVRGAVGADAEDMWLVGLEGLVLHYAGKAGQALTPEESTSIATLYDVVRFADGAVVAVGDLGTVLRRQLFPVEQE